MSPGPNNIERLRDLQKREGWLSEKGLEGLSRECGVPIHELFGVASFYPEFHLTPPPRVKVQVCTALPCQMRGSEPLMCQLEDLAKDHPDVMVRRAPCLGACECAPVVIIDSKIQTCRHGRTVEQIYRLVENVIAGTETPQSHPPAGVKSAYFRGESGEFQPGFKVDPYINPASGQTDAAAHFDTLRQVIARGDHLLASGEKYPKVIKNIGEAKLRGMGGAGAPAERKWTQVFDGISEEKFIVANADESEPGTLKDREIMRKFPHLVVEGMIIAGITLGAQQGYIYLRHEYELQHEALELAIKHARELGFLGNNVGGSGRRFDLRVFVSPGGYVLGEVSALLEALEGKRGQPRNGLADLGDHGLPSFNGLWGKPTLVNNIETYLYVPIIQRNGPQWFLQQGVDPAEGIKFASVCGDVVNPGVFEIPMGITFRQLIEMAGGPRGGWSNFKAFAPSGPSFGFRPEADLNATIDFRKGSTGPPTIGSGAVIVLDQSRCMVDAALNFTQFFRNESCGKCVPCRVGSQQMVNLIKMLRGYEGHRTDDTRRAQAAAASIKPLNDVLLTGSICGLGKAVPIPLETIMKYWMPEVEMHMTTGKCSASGCPAVIRGVNQ